MPGAAGEGGAPDDLEPPEGGLLPNEYPVPLMCAEPRPAMPPLLSVPAGCAPGCREIVGFALDATLGCIDTAAGTVVACSCGTQTLRTNNSETCLKTADGRKWLVVRGNEFEVSGRSAASPPATYDPSVYAACNEDEWDELRAASTCELEGCAQSFRSHCRVAGANASIWTQSCDYRGQTYPAYDAQGCLKPSCESDDDCSAEARCVRGIGWVPNCAFDSDGACHCNGPWSVEFDPAVCVDVASAGPRGVWESYRVEDFERNVVWLLRADGTLEITARGMPKKVQVSVADLEALNESLNGYWMRAGLQNGFDCELLDGSGVPGTATLVVAGKTYARDLTGCFHHLPLTLVLREYGR